MDGIIYIATNEINNKVYIGQTIQGLPKRKRAHINKALLNKDNIYFMNTIRKYGVDNFKWEIICECPIQDLNQQEVYWIKYFDSHKNGYNLRPGGKNRSGYKLSKEHIKKITESKQNISDSTKKKMSISRKKRIGKLSPSFDNTIYTFIHPIYGIQKLTQIELKTKYNVNQGNLSNMVNGKRKSVNKWKIKK